MDLLATGKVPQYESSEASWTNLGHAPTDQVSASCRFLFRLLTCRACGILESSPQFGTQSRDFGSVA
jgi:hypothetical protein